jgi:hypothetical protein
MKSQSGKNFAVGLLWISTLLFLVCFYSGFADYALKKIPYSFLLLAPFGWGSFFGWAMALGVSFWAAYVLGWDQPSLHTAGKWLVVVACGMLLMHGAWVFFVVSRGDL